MPFTMPIRASVVAALAALLALIAIAVLPPPPAAARGCKGANSQKLSMRQATGALFCLVNRERAVRGLRPLRGNRKLARIARLHARDSVRFQFIGHTSPRRGSLSARIKRSRYRPRSGSFSFGEILGAGRGRWGTPRAVVREWMTQHIHRTAILYPRFRRMGVGGTRGMPSRNMKRRGRNFVITFAS